MNFKSNAAYKKWLAYGHASGEFAKTPGNQPVSIKGQSHKVKHEMGGNMYKNGGSFNNKGFEALPIGIQKKIKDNSKKFAEGGQASMGGPGKPNDWEWPVWLGGSGYNKGLRRPYISYSPVANNMMPGVGGGMKREFTPGQSISYVIPHLNPKSADQNYATGLELNYNDWYNKNYINPDYNFGSSAKYWMDDLNYALNNPNIQNMENTPFPEIAEYLGTNVEDLTQEDLNSYRASKMLEGTGPKYTEPSKFPGEVSARLTYQGALNNRKNDSASFFGAPFRAYLGAAGGYNPSAGFFGGLEAGGTGFLGNLKAIDYIRKGLTRPGQYMVMPQLTTGFGLRQNKAPIFSEENINKYVDLLEKDKEYGTEEAAKFSEQNLGADNTAGSFSWFFRPQVKAEWKPFKKNLKDLTLQGLAGLDINMTGPSANQRNPEKVTGMNSGDQFGDLEPILTPYGKIAAILPINNVVKKIDKMLPNNSGMRYQGRIKNKGYEGNLGSAFGVRPIEPPVIPQVTPQVTPEVTPQVTMGIPDILKGPQKTLTPTPEEGGIRNRYYLPGSYPTIDRSMGSAEKSQNFYENFLPEYGDKIPGFANYQPNSFNTKITQLQPETQTGFKMGGNMRTYASGGMLDNQLTEFKNGGKHEENPIGGIPQGFSPDGRVNLVEEGETKLNSSDYVFSDTLKVTKDVALDYALPKDAVGKTYAEVSKKMNRPNSRRENDTIEEVAKQRDLDNLMQAQEDFKQRDLQKDIDMMNQKHPEFMAQMMGQGQPQGMDQQMMAQGVPPEQLMQMQGGMPPEAMMQAPQSVQPMGMPQGMPMDPNQIPPEMLAQMPEAQMGQPVMAYGGHMYRCGGKMYNFGGNMYGQGGQMLRGLGAAAYGAGEGLLDTLSFGLTDQLTDRGYNALTNIGNRTPEELAREASLRGFANTAGAVTGGVLSGGAAMGNAISEGSEGLGQGLTNIAGTGERFDNVANTIANLGSMAGSFIGNPADAAANTATETADAMSKVPKFAQKIMGAAKNEKLKQIPGVLDSVAGIVGQGIENNAMMNEMTEQEIMNQPRMVTGYNMAPTPMQMKYGGYKAQAPWHSFPQYTPNYPGNAGPMYMGLGTNLFNQGGYMNRNNTMYSPDLTYAAKMGGQLYNYGGGLNAPLMPTVQDDFVRYDEGGKIVQGKGEDPYQYKSENGKYYTAKKGTSTWSEISPLNKDAYNAVKAIINSAPATSTDIQDFKDIMMSNMQAEEQGDIVAPTIEEAEANQALRASQEAMQNAETSEEYMAAATEYQSVLERLKEKLANRDTDLSMNQGLLSGAAMAIPAAYNLGAGIFGKAEQLDPRKYMIPEDITPYEYNINPELANARQTYAQAQEAFRNASMGGGDYLANMQQLANQRNQTIGELYANKENLDAKQIQDAKIANKEIQTANLARQMEIEEFNRLSKAAKQGLLQTGLTQLADIGKNAESKKLDLTYIKAVAPEFADKLSYSSLGEQFLKFLQSQKEANSNKTK